MVPRGPSLALMEITPQELSMFSMHARFTDKLPLFGYAGFVGLLYACAASTERSANANICGGVSAP